MTVPSPSRRRFLIAALAGATGASLTTLGVHAAPLQKIPESDPTAQALGYREDAAKVDASKEATFQKGRTCANCVLYQAAQAQGGYGPCGAFAGKGVNAAGWCRAWALKPTA